MEKKLKGHLISKVDPGSIGEELELEPGDCVLTINGNPIEDIFDYEYYVNSPSMLMTVRKADGEEWELDIENDYEDLGLTFENGLMSEYRSCSNKCIFCFIDQMPPGMRETLYFKDDDTRLSFLQGNYVTLTNLKEKDIERIIRFKLAPINISVQTTNPELRCKMLHNRFAGQSLKLIDRLYEAGTPMNGQIVLCKGVNDGEELKRSIEDLTKYIPCMQSVSVVPVGLSKYRDGLYPLEPFTKEDACQVIDLIEMWQKKLYTEHGIHFIHASDEWYITAQREFPEEERYDGYIQLENGVGMMRMFINEFQEELKEVLAVEAYTMLKEGLERTITIATGKLAFPTVRDFARQLMEAFPGLTIHVYAIRNHFFGETITVSGLITGQDLVTQLKEQKEHGKDLGDTLLIPSNMLRSGEQVFLDDLTVEDVEAALEMKLTAVETGGREFIDAILYPDYEMDRNNENFVYIQAYDKAGQ